MISFTYLEPADLDEALAALARYGDEAKVIAGGTGLVNLMKQRPGWKLLYDDPLSALFGRDGLPQVAAIERTPVSAVPHDGTGLCFP